MVKARDCGIVVREFVLQSLSDKYPWERYEPPYLPSYGLNSTTTVSSWRMALALNNLKKSWYAIKQRNQTKHTTLSNKVRGIFFKELCRSSLSLCRYDSACICIWVYNSCKWVRTPVALLRSLSDKYPWERYEPPYPPSYGLNSTTTVSSWRMALALNNLKKNWYAIKQRNQTKPWYGYVKRT